MQDCLLSTMYKLPFHEVGGIIHPRPMGNLWGSGFLPWNTDICLVYNTEYRRVSGVWCRTHFTDRCLANLFPQGQSLELCQLQDRAGPRLGVPRLGGG